MTALTVAGATSTLEPFPGATAALRRAMPAVITAFDDGTAAPGTYQLTWDDSHGSMLAVYGVQLELERHGIRTVLPPELAAITTSHRTARPAETDGLVAYVTGAAVERWRARPGIVELVHVPAPPGDVAEMASLRASLVGSLLARNRPDLAAMVDADLFSLKARTPEVPLDLFPLVLRMQDLAVPTSVFLVPFGSG